MVTERFLKPGPLLDQLINEAVSGSNVLPLTGYCNLNCLFCSHRYNPPGIQAYSFPPLAYEKIEGLIEGLAGRRKIVIGESATRLREGEPLTHPCLVKILEALRRRFPRTLIQVTTNGSKLTESLIEKLSALKPLEIILSVNSADAAVRFRLMGDHHSKATLASISALSGRDIPFHGSIVGLPHLTGWEDLENAALFIQQSGALSVRYLVAGFSQFFNSAYLPPEGWQRKARAPLAALKAKLQIPFFIDPPYIDNLDPLISGVLPDTPAAGAGCKAGDLVVALNGIKPFSRVEAFNLAQKMDNPCLDLVREGKRISKTLVKKKGQSSGLAFDIDLDPSQVERVCSALSPSGKTLMLVSVPAFERWKLAKSRLNLESLHLWPVISHYFGGTIDSAGLLTVNDFARVLDIIPAPENYGQVLLPAIAFNIRGNDLAGQSFLSLNQRNLHIKLID